MDPFLCARQAGLGLAEQVPDRESMLATLDLLGLWVVTGCMPDELVAVPARLHSLVKSTMRAMGDLRDIVGTVAFDDWLEDLYPDAERRWAEARGCGRH